MYLHTYLCIYLGKQNPVASPCLDGRALVIATGLATVRARDLRLQFYRRAIGR